MSTPGEPPTTTPPQGPTGAQHPPPAAARDSTRTIAVVALVVGSVALLGQLLAPVVPVLLFGVFGMFATGFESDEGFGVDTGVMTVGGGQVTPAPDGSVSSASLTSAVRDTLGIGDPTLPPAGEVSCDATARAATDTSVLCRADVDRWYGIVRFADSSGSFEVLAVDGDGWGMP